MISGPGEKQELLYTGKAKKAYATQALLIVSYKDGTAFESLKKGETGITGKSPASIEWGDRATFRDKMRLYWQNQEKGDGFMLTRRKYLLITAAVLAALACLGIVWAKAPFCARLCFSARLYAMSCFADTETRDGLTEDGYSLVLQSKKSLAFLAETAWNAGIEDVTDCCLSTWPTPLYYANDWEIGGNGCLIHYHCNRIYIFHPGNHSIEKRFAEFLSVS